MASSNKAADANGDSRAADGDVDVPSKSGWLVGEELVGAQKENNWESSLELRWPFRPNKVADDWEGREYIMCVRVSVYAWTTRVKADRHTGRIS